MQNLGPAQVETLYENTSQGSSLCDNPTAGTLGLAIIVERGTIQIPGRSEWSTEPLVYGWLLTPLPRALQSGEGRPTQSSLSAVTGQDLRPRGDASDLQTSPRKRV